MKIGRLSIEWARRPQKGKVDAGPTIYALERKVGNDWVPNDGGLFAGDDEECTAEERCHRHKGWMENHFVDYEFRVMAYRRANAK